MWERKKEKELNERQKEKKENNNVKHDVEKVNRNEVKTIKKKRKG